MSLARLAGRARDSWLECLGAPLWLISTQQGAVCPPAYWIIPGTLEALIPGRMQGHGGTEEVSR